MAAISQDIYTGGLNRYLLFPAHYLPFKYAQRLGALGPGVLQFVLFGAVAYLWLGLDMHVSVWSDTMALGCVVVASFLYFLIDLVIHLIAFWADNVWSLDVGKWFLISILGGYMLPLSVFPEPSVSSSSVATKGCRTATGPLAVIETSCHRPMFLSGGIGFQSTQVIARSSCCGAKTST